MTATVLGQPWMLPTERLIPGRQLELVDAVLALGGDSRAVSAAEIGARLRLSRKSVSGAAGFLVQARLLEPGRGAWSLTEQGATLARLRVTDSARARLHLRDHWRDSWFRQRACQHLGEGPLEESELADILRAGLQGQAERGLFMVEWMVYALLLERDEEGKVRLPADQTPSPAADKMEQPATPLGIFDPLLTSTAAEISALPDDKFIALMGAYRTIFTALAPQAPRQRSS
ncbi:hypothetical protein [Streptomyces albidoflavus]|uniref:hypothetical protein n=1 Tax=Streptomyces albidoflavus TaxID=1886 RepID=UPI0033E06C34